MRVPDTLFHNAFLNNYSTTKERLAEIQLQMVTQSKVNKPSDNPLSNARILRLNNQLGSLDTYKSNINYAKSSLNDSILAMESMQTEVQDVLVQLTQSNSALTGDDLKVFAESIDSSLDILVDLANSDFNGKYSFGGTETDKAPINYDTTNKIITTNSNDIGGVRSVKISSNINQEYNITGKDLFQSVFSISGSIDSTAAVGDTITQSGKVYNSEGKEFSLDLTFTKTAANTYDMDYTVTDENLNIVENNTVNNLVYDTDTGEIKSIDGSDYKDLHISNTANKLDFLIDVSDTHESDSGTSLTKDLNQKADIFNTLISIREKLSNGEKPTAEQFQIVEEFNSHILNNLSTAGGISNKFDATEQVLQNQETELSSLLSKEKDVDVAKALLELESAQYTLDTSYKISSMVLPNSLLDYF